MNKIQQLQDANGNNIYPIAYAAGGCKLELLWTNPSPTSTFAAQTVALDLSDYHAVFILFRRNTSDENYYSKYYLKTNDSKYQMLVAQYGTIILDRGCKVDDDGLRFNDSYNFATNVANRTVDNNQVIPYKVYGYKMSYVVPTEVHGLQYTDEGNNVIQLMNNDGTENLYPIQDYEEYNDVGSNMSLTRTGRLCVLNLSNAFASTAISSSGYELPVTANKSVIATCMYYNGSTNISGFIQIIGNKLFLKDSTHGVISKTYITGSISFFID